MAKSTHQTKPAHRPAGRHPLTVPHLRWGLPLAAVFLGVIVGVGLLLLGLELRDQPVNLSLGHARVIAQGQQATSDWYNVTVSNPRRIPGDAAFAPADGDDILVVNISITNRDEVAHNFFPSIHTYLRDTADGYFVMHPSLSVTDGIAGGEIKSGATVTGELSYEVPQRESAWRYYFDPQWGDMAPVVFSLQL